MTQRFGILVSPWWRPLLLLGGATPSRSFIELGDGTLRVRFGWLFDHSFPIETVEDASPRRLPLWVGIGWHMDFCGGIALTGSLRNGVEIRFREPQRVRMLIPLRCRRLAVSLENPQGFLDALAQTRR